MRTNKKRRLKTMKLNAMNINNELLESIAATSIAALENSPRPDARRWQSAIKKGINELQENCYWQYADGELLMMSATSGTTYQSNGDCQCRAFEQGQPCRHRAAARLLDRYAQTV
jgi:hypothetical protein